MKKILRKIYNNYFKPYLPQSLRQRLQRADSMEYPIIKNPDEIFEKVYHIKDATWEKARMLDVYQIAKSWEMLQYHEAQDILLVRNCSIGNMSDIVIAENGVIWEKAYSAIFSKMVPQDIDGLDYDRKHIRIRKIPNVEHVQGACLSLMGVHSNVWSHFLVQYLPKLYYAEEAGILDRDISVILPEYEDLQVEYLVNRVLESHPKVKRIVIPKGVGRFRIKCDELYYMPTTARISNHAEYLTPYDIVIPKRVSDILKERVITPLIEKAKSIPSTHDKLYLVRRGERGMSNIEEVEKYFKDKGFYFVEPHLLKIEEKVSLFSHAKIIVGPQSSAWTNVIFCNKAKGLVFTTICRTLDAYGAHITNSDMLEWLLVTGDDKSSTIHSDFYIPIKKIDEAYQYLLNERIE